VASGVAIAYILNILIKKETWLKYRLIEENLTEKGEIDRKTYKSHKSGSFFCINYKYIVRAKHELFF
jgi:hypothetical protein